MLLQASWLLALVKPKVLRAILVVGVVLNYSLPLSMVLMRHGLVILPVCGKLLLRS